MTLSEMPTLTLMLDDIFLLLVYLAAVASILAIGALIADHLPALWDWWQDRRRRSHE